MQKSILPAGALLTFWDCHTNLARLSLITRPPLPQELDDETRLLYAKLCIALARRDQEVTLCLADQAGLEITGVPDEFKCAAVHVLFDTNMDMEVRPSHAAPRSGKSAGCHPHPYPSPLRRCVLKLGRGGRGPPSLSALASAPVALISIHDVTMSAPGIHPRRRPA